MDGERQTASKPGQREHVWRIIVGDGPGSAACRLRSQVIDPRQLSFHRPLLPAGPHCSRVITISHRQAIVHQLTHFTLSAYIQATSPAPVRKRTTVLTLNNSRLSKSERITQITISYPLSTLHAAQTTFRSLNCTSAVPPLRSHASLPCFQAAIHDAAAAAVSAGAGWRLQAGRQVRHCVATALGIAAARMLHRQATTGTTYHIARPLPPSARRLHNRCLPQRPLAARPARRAVAVYAVATQTKTVKIGTRGSPLALAQAYLTRDLLKVRAASLSWWLLAAAAGAIGGTPAAAGPPHASSSCSSHN